MYFPPFYSCTDGAKDWAKAADTIVRCCPRYGRPYRPASGPLVGADAHIGPPGSVCKAVRRPKASPWRPRGPQGSAASGRYSDRSGQAEGLTEGIRADGDWELTIPQSRCASQLPLHKGACPHRRWGWRRSAGYGGRRGPGRAADSRPYGCASGLLVGADAHIGPLGIDIKSTVAERTHRRGAHGASGTGCDIRGPVVDVPGSGRNFCIAPTDAGPYDIAAL